jgi:hypothetical protein
MGLYISPTYIFALFRLFHTHTFVGTSAPKIACCGPSSINHKIRWVSLFKKLVADITPAQTIVKKTRWPSTPASMYTVTRELLDKNDGRRCATIGLLLRIAFRNGMYFPVFTLDDSSALGSDMLS